MESRPELFPSVRFEPGFALRLERCVRARPRLAGLHEGRAPFAHASAGGELVGLRAYRPGDDPRLLDWNASARSDHPIVRVLRPESGERWSLILDASASMGVGPPGKLQRAAEVAVAVAVHAARSGAEIELCVEPSGARFCFVRRRPLAELLSFLTRVRAEGVLADPAARSRGARRVIWIGDLAGLDPTRLLAARPRHAALHVLQILAPHEFSGISGDFGPVAWWDPESDAGVEVDVDVAALAHFERERTRSIDGWRRVLAHARAHHVCATSARPFEELFAALALP